jgi:hypothetical protein
LTLTQLLKAGSLLLFPHGKSLLDGAVHRQQLSPDSTDESESRKHER